MEITVEDKKVLKKIVESPDWEVYQRVVAGLIEEMKNKFPTVDMNLSDEEYARKLKIMSLYVNCFEIINSRISSLLFSKDVSVNDILEQLDPYTKQK
jgi:hypothetical protein